MIFKYAYDMRLIKAMPSEGIKRPKKTVSVEELEEIEIHKSFLKKMNCFNSWRLLSITIHHRIASRYLPHWHIQACVQVNCWR